MILKGSQRGGGQDLAHHLMRLDDNEHVSLHELRGFAGQDLREAFKEAEAIARGTRCRQYLFSLSLSPPEDACCSAEEFQAAIDQAESRLGLEGQPRAIVFHEKEGRRHAHCVWSRIDAETMTARHLAFSKNKLMEVSRELYLEHGWKLPKGLTNHAERNPTNFTLAEWQQAKRQEIDPRWLKSTVQECWSASDGRPGFEAALLEHGFFLAKGDRRGHVLVDHSGEVWSLSRLLALKAREVRARLGDGADLRSVQDTLTAVGERMSPAMRRHVADSRGAFAREAEELNRRKAEMTRLHRDARRALLAKQDAEWLRETAQRQARIPHGLKGLWHRLTGQYREVRRRNEEEAAATVRRHAEERRQMVARQFGERRALQSKVKELRHAQAARLAELRRDVGRYLRFARGGADRGQARSRAQKVRQPGLRLHR